MMKSSLSDVSIRDAATIIVVRDRLTAPKLLMGQRGRNAAFMPEKFVFPGGAVDAGDDAIPLARPLNPVCAARIGAQSSRSPAALASAAIRELWEEAGLRLGVVGDWPQEVPQGWQSFAAGGCVPDASALQFVFRAITPPGRPRRFDARFFRLDAEVLGGDLDDFSAADDELAHLQWIPLEQVHGFDLPFITQIVVDEIAQNLGQETAPLSVPFVRNDEERSEITDVAMD